jgi:hypothetical protein
MHAADYGQAVKRRGRRHDARMFPEILAERLSLGRVRAGLILAARLASISLREYLTIVDFALIPACLLRIDDPE